MALNTANERIHTSEAAGLFKKDVINAKSPDSNRTSKCLAHIVKPINCHLCITHLPDICVLFIQKLVVTKVVFVPSNLHVYSLTL